MHSLTTMSIFSSVQFSKKAVSLSIEQSSEKRNVLKLCYLQGKKIELSLIQGVRKEEILRE